MADEAERITTLEGQQSRANARLKSLEETQRVHIEWIAGHGGRMEEYIKNQTATMEGFATSIGNLEVSMQKITLDHSVLATRVIALGTMGGMVAAFAFKLIVKFVG